MGNPFVYVELHSSDVAKARTFYGDLLDWDFQTMAMPVGDYTVIGVGDGTGGGMMAQREPNGPSRWLPYIGVDDVAVAAAKARTLGAAVVQEKTEVPDMGWFAVITDPTGATVALWQAKSQTAHT
ncbi:MAG: VOC family protein [Alphaproteobacteria bacterium]